MQNMYTIDANSSMRPTQHAQPTRIPFQICLAPPRRPHSPTNMPGKLLAKLPNLTCPPNVQSTGEDQDEKLDFKETTFSLSLHI